jgi:hypothetical protein
MHERKRTHAHTHAQTHMYEQMATLSHACAQAAHMLTHGHAHAHSYDHMHMRAALQMRAFLRQHARPLPKQTPTYAQALHLPTINSPAISIACAPLPPRSNARSRFQ